MIRKGWLLRSLLSLDKRCGELLLLDRLTEIIVLGISTQLATTIVFEATYTAANGHPLYKMWPRDDPLWMTYDIGDVTFILSFDKHTHNEQLNVIYLHVIKDLRRGLQLPGGGGAGWCCVESPSLSEYFSFFSFFSGKKKNQKNNFELINFPWRGADAAAAAVAKEFPYKLIFNVGTAVPRTQRGSHTILVNRSIKKHTLTHPTD